MLISSINPLKRNHLGQAEMQSSRLGIVNYKQPSGLLGLRKYRLTGLFLLVSTMIFASVALAINITTTHSEEEQIVSATTAESVKDAKVVAGVVTRLLDSSSGVANIESEEGVESSSPRNIVNFLTESEIVRLNLYLPDGTTAWSSTAVLTEMEPGQRQIFDASLSGAIATGLVRGTSVIGTAGIVYDADVVETFIPISDLETGSPEFVLGVTRDVTAVLSASIIQSRSAIFRSTSISLGAGFLVLLITVFIADIRMWKQRVVAVAHERALASHELSVAKMNLANHELRQVTDEREKILSTVSLELKTPLASMIAFTDILSRNQSGETATQNLQHLAVVKRSGDHLLSLINDLLSSNRVGSVDTGFHCQVFETVELFDEIQGNMGPILAAKNQTLAIEGVHEDQSVRLDRRRFVQALTNIISNGSKFSSEGSVILIGSSIEDNELKIFVADPGIGISDEKRAELFSREALADTPLSGSYVENGQGFGFRIARDIVEAHGGQIDVESVLGQGTRVSVVIPTGLGE
jgi:signal transduction histidine kinase